MTDSFLEPHPAILTYGLDRPPTGLGRSTINIITGLGKTGVSLTLLGNTATYLPNANMFPLVPLPSCRLLPGLMTIGNFIIPLAAQRNGFNIVHDSTGSAPFLFGAGPAKTIVTVQDMFALAFPGTSTLLENIITRFWLPFVLPRMDAIITVSECSKNDIMRFVNVPAEKIHVIPNSHMGFSPMDRETAQKNISRFGLSAGYILTISSFDPRRNLPRLLEAYANLRREGERRPLVIVGKPRLRNNTLLPLIEKLELQNQIIFPGYILSHDLPAIYCGADLFVFPSLYEGFGIPPLEAMACGTPVVTSNTSALPEVVGDAAIMVDPYNVDALAEGMRRVLADPTLQADLRARGLKRAAEFNWERTACQTLEVYKQVLS